MKAKPRRPWVLGIGAVALGASCVAAQMIWWEGLNEQLFFIWLLFVVAPMCVVLGLYLVSEYRGTVRRFRHSLLGTWRCSRCNLASGLSLGCAGVVIVVWVLSEWQWCYVRWETAPGKYISVYSSLSVLGVEVTSDPVRVMPWSTGFQLRRVDTTRFIQRRYFALGTYSFPVGVGKVTFSRINFPHALPVAALLVLPTLCVLRGYRRWRDRGEHYCSKCDYDLTGNVSGVCPECGTAVESSATANKSQSF